MSKTKEFYQVQSVTGPELARELNFILARIADRLDKLEGLRGTATVENALEVLDEAQHKIHSLE